LVEFIESLELELMMIKRICVNLSD